MTVGGPTSSDVDVPVLFAGGGLVGLSTAMFLAQHGIEPRIGMEIGSNGGPRDCVYLCTQQLRLRLATAGWLFSTSPACQRSGSGSWCIQRQNE